MLPDNELSATPIVADFLYPDNKEYNPRIDYEYGGVALQDPSQGLRVHVWQAVVTKRGIMVSCPATNYSDLTISGEGITECSLAFSFNMHLYISYVQNDVAYLYWYNTSTGHHETLELGNAYVGSPSINYVDRGDYVNPRICLDEKRLSQSLVADVILVYLKKSQLVMRLQRDNFAVEYDLGGAGGNRIHKVGMTKNYRLRIEMGFRYAGHNSSLQRIR